MNTRTLAGGKAFAAAQFQRQAKQVQRQAQKQIKKGAQTAKRQVQKTNTGRTEQDLWIPNAERPFWLDGSLPGDRGFDPFQLARPVDYAQFDLDQNPPSGIFAKGEYKGNYAAPQRYIASSPIAPWNDALGLDRLRENEIINGRWAMLAVLGILVAEAVTGVQWQDAGKVELDPSGPTYWGFKLPFSVSQSVWFEVIGVGLAEIFRSQAEDVEDRIYPGGAFDPLKLTEIQDEYRLRESEVLHGRLAMVAFAGLALQAGFRGTGAFASIDQSSIDAAGVSIEAAVDAI